MSENKCELERTREWMRRQEAPNEYQREGERGGEKQK